MKTPTKIWASCENCGLLWTEMKLLPKVWKAIKCPKCKHKTDNFDDVNHNKSRYFINYK